MALVLSTIFFHSSWACDPDLAGYQKALEKRVLSKMHRHPQSLKSTKKLDEKRQFVKNGDCPSLVEGVYEFEFRDGCKARVEVSTAGYTHATAKEVKIVKRHSCGRKAVSR